MNLNESLIPSKGSRKNRKRLGRGVGSGLGKTSGRGMKGQRSRSGGRMRAGFEGGQMPIHRRLPKRGFTNIFKVRYQTINIRDLMLFESNVLIDEDMLIRKGIIKNKKDGIKLLGYGKLENPLTIKVNSVSKSAREKVETAGGKVEVI